MVADVFGLHEEKQQLVARIKRSSKYYGQTGHGAWFDVRVVDDREYSLRGNNNNYRLSDVVLGVRLGSGTIVDLVSGKSTHPRAPTFKAGSSELIGER